MKCSKCGTDFEGKFCPECGTPAEESPKVDNSSTEQTPAQEPINTNYVNTPTNKVKKKKPFYKKWWFIVIVIIAVLGFGGKLFGGGSDKTEKIDWAKMEIGSYLPEPNANKGKIWNNTNEELKVNLEDVSKDDYSDYVKACEEKGFTVDADKTDWSYEAYNADGYKLHLSIISDEMSIELNAPMKFTTLEWPTSTVGKLLPVPKSTTGTFSFENDKSFFVYVGETSKADYSEYVKACSDAGFNVDYDKDDTYYRADNSTGYHISLEFEGNNIMSIRIDSPDEETETSKTNVESETKETEKTNSLESSTTSNDSNLVNGMRKDFKEAMDSYEAFMNEYVAFMEKYSKSNGTDSALIADYAKYISKYADMCKKFDKWESEDLNTAETAYYIDVQTRVNKKLLTVAAN